MPVKMASDKLEIRAQIWKQMEPSADDASENRYNLLWEHRVNGTVASDTGILWRVSGFLIFADEFIWIPPKTP